MRTLSRLRCLCILAVLISTFACGGGETDSDLATPSAQQTSTSNPTQAAATTTQVTATATPTTTATDASVMPNTLQAHNFQILDRHPDPKLDCINDSMDVFIDVFGVVVIATNSAPLPFVLHTAGVLAQFLDNDEDGVPDEPNVLDKLVEGNYVVPVWSKQEEEEFFQLRTVGSCENNIGMAASMYFDHDAWALGGIQSTGTWDTNLEEVWHVISRGWYEAYPQEFKDSWGYNSSLQEWEGSRLSRAMDAARGGRFEDVPSAYPSNAWYTYYDLTCGYSCQVAEYFYWALMANIDALDRSLTNKCERSKDEWYVCNREELLQKDPLVFDLLNNRGWVFPVRIPDGNYQVNTVSSTSGNELDAESKRKELEAPDWTIMSKHPTLDCLNETFDKFVNVFGMYVIGTPEAEEKRVNHSAGVLAQYLDNDEDGHVDDINVLNSLIEENYVVPLWTQNDQQLFRSELCEEKISFGASMYLNDNYAFGGIETAGHWDANLEEIWHIITKGWDRTYPEYFGSYQLLNFDDADFSAETSRIAEAMDAARGGQFRFPPDTYPNGSWYKYYDPTCSYECQIYEYFYWILMANIGALDPKYTDQCESRSFEWPICSKEELQLMDPRAYDLLNNQGFNLPTRIPNGNYQGNS